MKTIFLSNLKGSRNQVLNEIILTLLIILLCHAEIVEALNEDTFIIFIDQNNAESTFP